MLNSRYASVNLYFQDESRFGLMTHVGKCIAAKGVQPIVNYQHKFSNTYLFGSYSPIDGDSFVWEINGVDTKVFEQYLMALSKHRINEFKIVLIDNAGFHSTKNITIPENIYLLRIPPYCPELNPCEQVWKEFKKYFKNKVFLNMTSLKEWLYNKVNTMTKKQIISITSNHHFIKTFNAAFNS